MNARTWTERIWYRANQRSNEARKRHDERIQGALTSHACDVLMDDGVMCGCPLDEDGLCELHE